MSSRRNVVRDALDRDLSAMLADNVEVETEPEAGDDTDLEVLVGRSIRLPLRADEALKRAARERGTTPSTLIRQWVEAGLAEMDEDRVVSLAEVRRALASLPPPSRPRGLSPAGK